MRQIGAARRAPRRAATLPVAAFGLVTAAIIGTLLYHSASSSALSFSDVPSMGAHRGVPQPASSSAPSSSPPLGSDHRPATTKPGRVTVADGALPKGVTVFDDRYPGIGNLDPDLLRALRAAAADAADDGVEVDETSGWRSRKYQDELLQQAVSEYGSQHEAARWVATAETSPHVSGDAVDIAPVDAVAWLSRHGAVYGLCQIYRNEPWHYELRREAIDVGCPAMYADPTRDPRMQQ
jgi:zinc D-Ala-D-Ala carboxypeptidase